MIFHVYRTAIDLDGNGDTDALVAITDCTDEGVDIALYDTRMNPCPNWEVQIDPAQWDNLKIEADRDYQNALDDAWAEALADGANIPRKRPSSRPTY